MERFMIGMDIGGTNIRIGAVDSNYGVQHLEKVYQKNIFSDEDSPACLIRFIEAFIEKNRLDGNVDGISIAMPATINREGTTVLQAPGLTGFDNRNLVSPLESHFGIKVILLKDVWAAGFCRWRAFPENYWKRRYGNTRESHIRRII